MGSLIHGIATTHVSVYVVCVVPLGWRFMLMGFVFCSPPPRWVVCRSDNLCMFLVWFPLCKYLLQYLGLLDLGFWFCCCCCVLLCIVFCSSSSSSSFLLFLFWGGWIVGALCSMSITSCSFLFSSQLPEFSHHSHPFFLVSGFWRFLFVLGSGFCSFLLALCIGSWVPGGFWTYGYPLSFAS